ncbi:hypothetical protein [Agrobacterium tumefaciens]|uniref:hypothetical protein n=1 Tax=Agrobacterium tumefaciens TaxID=358 RepID=UPI00287C805E|nr:hypothetical protein [Agrobacterium tumefaciens]MDS7595511.1 hypothetical protein [Agrobacterium tumefaciens]
MEQIGNPTGKGRRKALWAAVAVIAVVAAGVVGIKSVYEAKVNELVARSGGTADSIDVDFLGRIHLRNLTLPLANGTTVRIAAVDGRPKVPFLESAIEASDVDIAMPTGTVSMPTVRIEEASVDRDLLNAVVDSKDAVSVSKQVQSFAAKRISVPEVNTTQSFANISQKTVYKDVALTDIANGKIAHYSAGNGNYDITLDVPDSEGATKKKQLVVSTGAITGQDFDAAYLARLYTEKAGADDKDAKPLYGPMSVRAITVSDGDSHFSYDEARSDGVSMRMPAEPLMETLEALTATTDLNELSPQERQAFIAKALSIFDMMGKMDVQLLGFKADATITEGEAAGERMAMSVERMAIQLDNSKVSLSQHGMSIKIGEDTIEVAEASIDGFDWSSTFKGLHTLAGLDEQQIETFPFGQLMPEFGTIRLAGLNVDVAASKDEDAEGQDDAAASVPERVKFALKNYEMALTKPYNGIPTDIQIRQEDLVLPIPENSTDETLVQMRKLGMDVLTLSYGLAAGWDEANNNLVIREISFNGKDIGSVDFSGLVSGFTEEFFSLDTGRMQAALFGLAGREVKLTIKDEGLISKGIKLYAAENGMTEDQVRGVLTMVATAGLQEIASTRPNLQNATEALLRFISSPGSLTVTAKATGPNGLGLFDFVAASQDPMLLLDKVEIEATAN